MRKLNRGSAPACLNNYRHGRDSWGSVSPNDKEAIWTQITAMQANFCAYCESLLNNKKKHIEHFFRRSQTPQRSFDWSNIFGSCDEPDTCGRYKDNKAPSTINLYDVCKPDEADPSIYFFFSGDGSVVPKEGLDTRQLNIAENTIQVFNLNGSAKLTGKRREAARKEQYAVDKYYQLIRSSTTQDEDPELMQLFMEELNENLARINNEEHSAVLKQLWPKQ